MHIQRHDEAISEYSAALSLDPALPQNLFIKRSKAHVAKGLWNNGLQDADKVRPFILRKLILVNDNVLRR